MGDVHGAGAQRQMQVGLSSFIVVQMHMAQARTESGQDVFGGIPLQHQIRVANIQMQPHLGKRLQQLGQFTR